MKLFDLAGINSFSSFDAEENSAKLHSLAVFLSKDDPSEAVRAQQLSEIFMAAHLYYLSTISF